MQILPCEFVDRNALVLRDLVLDQARAWRYEDDLVAWIEGAARWFTTLVDRIVSAPPEDHVLSPTDKLLCVAEPFAVWIVEGAPPSEHAAIEAVADVGAWTDGDLPTVVFDATGNQDSMNGAFRFVASTGRLVFVGLFQGDFMINDPEFHRRKVTLLATRNSRSDDFRRIIHLMASGDVDTASWVTHRATYDTFIESFPSWLDLDNGVVKTMFEMLGPPASLRGQGGKAVMRDA